jgi:hypothetical protein
VQFPVASFHFLPARSKYLPKHPVLKHHQTNSFFNVRVLTPNAQVRSQVISYGICGGRIGTGIFFLRLLRFYPVTIIPRVRRVHPSPTAHNLSSLQRRKTKVSPSLSQLTQGERCD